MTIDLTKIFEKQLELNVEIYQKHNVKGYNEVEQKVLLATLVELGELANEVRPFKYWSNKTRSEKDVVLDEYADGIHFISTICINADVNPIFEIEDGIEPLNNEELTHKFNKLYTIMSKIIKTGAKKKVAIKLMTKYLYLAFELGYTAEDIYNSYFKKHETNLKRQEQIIKIFV